VALFSFQQANFRLLATNENEKMLVARTTENPPARTLTDLQKPALPNAAMRVRRTEIERQIFNSILLGGGSRQQNFLSCRGSVIFAVHAKHLRIASREGGDTPYRAGTSGSIFASSTAAIMPLQTHRTQYKCEYKNAHKNSYA
jgi:hypothetical protein